jgi:type I restriction enzyme S subunit
MNAAPPVETLVTNHLDLWTAALKRKSTAGRGSSSKVELYGIRKLRELILELAVRGLLVPQDPNDEPASELLKKIAAEKAKLVKAGKIKKEKPLAPISENETPHNLPEGWAVERFGKLAIIERGGSPRPIQSYFTDSPDGLNWIKIGDTDIGGKYITNTKEKIVREGLSKTRMVYPGDFLLTNSMSFGRPYITKIEGCIHDGWLRISPAEQIDKDFLYWLLSSPYIVKSFTESAAGAVVQNLNSDKVREVSILLPPNNEQQRIVAKVDELMALCDQLEQQTDASLAAHQTLVETLLSALTSTADHAQFASAWQRIAGHFDTLFTTEESIAQLKQTILQLAVMGKLVPQDPNDEPASELLKKIAAEKARLVKEGKVKKGRPLPTIAVEEMQFELPAGWALTRLGGVIDLISGQHLGPTEYFESLRPGAIPYLTGPAEFGSKTPEPTRYTNERRAVSILGDILLTVKGSGVGKTNIVSQPEIAISRQLMALRSIAVDRNFLNILLATLAEKFQAQSVGIAIPGISREDVLEASLYLPALAEQHRIVAKVDALMALCNQLKSRLSDAQTTQLHLADALVEQAIC